jgi:hypothetical protein
MRSVGGDGIGKQLAVMFTGEVRGGFGKLHRAARTWFVWPSINAAIFSHRKYGRRPLRRRFVADLPLR